MTPPEGAPEQQNTLYYGDNLDILRRPDYIKSESVGLVYLDPPFKSNQDYNVLFAEQDGSRSAAQIKAFEDTWRWDQAAAASYQEVVEGGGAVSRAMQAFRTFLGESDMLAYLAMMAPRLIELRRVLKPTGSIYLHCDPTASHYLKMLMDAIFGPVNFVNEIVWKRSSAHSDTKQGSKHFGRLSDTLLFYSKDATANRTWNQPYSLYDPEYIERDYRRADPDGRLYRISDLSGPGGAAKGNPYYEVMGVKRHWRYTKEKMEELIRQGRVVQTRPGAVPQYKRYLDEMPGVPIQNMWTDIPVINNRSKEKLGYPTQKPEALLERIINASTNPGDTVLDPFCGCGTAIAVAQRLNRRWIGIDITQAAMLVIKPRLKSASFVVVGEPPTLEDAQALAQDSPHQFEWWALGLVGARPADPKKGADRGIDGRLYFHDDDSGQTKQIVLQVKSGHVSPGQVQSLRGAMEQEGAQIGVFITLQSATAAMRAAASAGFYQSPWGKHPRLQILTIEELLGGAKINYPPARQVNVTYKAPPKVPRRVAEQIDLPESKLERRGLAKAPSRLARARRRRRRRAS